MVVLSRLSMILGVLALLVGLGILIYSEFEVWKQWIAISANRSLGFQNPIPLSALGTAVAVLGGFLTGLGLSRRR